MSYGEIFTEPGGSGGLKPGVNKVFLTFVGLNNYKSSKGVEGSAFDFVFTSSENPSKEFRLRKFPIDDTILPQRYQDYVQNAQKRGNDNPLSYEEFRSRQYSDFNGEIKLIITQFMPATKFDEYRSRWQAKLKEKGKPQTFESFCHFVSTALLDACPTYKEIQGYLLLGYQPNSKYLSTPRFNSDASLYFATDPEVQLELWESSRMVFVKPVQTSGGSGFNVSQDDMPIGAATTAAGSNSGGTQPPAADDDDLPF